MNILPSLSLWAVVKIALRVLLWLSTIFFAYCLPGFIIDAIRHEDDKESRLCEGAACIDCALLILLLAILIKY